MKKDFDFTLVPTETSDIMVIDDISVVSDFEVEMNPNKWEIFKSLILDFRLGEVAEIILYRNNYEKKVSLFSFYESVDVQVPKLIVHLDYSKQKLQYQFISKERDYTEGRILELVELIGVIFNSIYNLKPTNIDSFPEMGLSPESSEIPERKSKESFRTSRIFTLNEYVERKRRYSPRSNTYQGTWEVRGHPREYKNGRVIFIKPYTKGEGKRKVKTYKLK